jgi:hypothetical protein
VNGTDYETLMVSSAYGSYEARLKPLIEAITTAGQRVLQATMPQQVTGVVTFQQGTLKVDTYTVPHGDKLAHLIRSFVGKTITIRATATQVEYVQGTVSTTANLRKSPHYYGTVIETLQTSATVEITGLSSNQLYYKATAPDGQTGYVFVYFVDVAQ